MKIEIKDRWNGTVTYAHACENNTMKITLLKAISEGVNLSGSDLSGCDLSFCNLSGCNLRNSNLSNSDFIGSDLRGCNLCSCDLSNSDFRGSDMRNSNLICCDLSACKLCDCDLRGSNFNGSNFTRTNIMIYAHIYKAFVKTGFKFELILSRSASICADEVLSKTLHMSKEAAKSAAKNSGAIAHNY